METGAAAAENSAAGPSSSSILPPPPLPQTPRARPTTRSQTAALTASSSSRECLCQNCDWVPSHGQLLCMCFTTTGFDEVTKTYARAHLVRHVMG